MACDKEILVLLSAFADGEATPSEASRVTAHLENCALCRGRLEEWRGQRQMFEWAYTVDLPARCDVERLAAKGTSTGIAARIPRLSSLVSLNRNWVRAGALLAAAIALFAIYRAVILPPVLQVGRTIAAVNESQNARIEGGVSLKIGPGSVVSRIDDRSIRLEKGWVNASVHHGSGLRILTKRMEVLDQGTRFDVGTGSRLDYVFVEEGSVSVRSGRTARQVSAGQLLTAADNGDPCVAAVPELRPGDEESGRPIAEVASAPMPRTGQELDYDEGLLRLAVRFPDLRLVDGVSGGSAWNVNVECGFYDMGIVGLRSALREHFHEIAQAAAGGRVSPGDWEIPVAVFQVIGELTTIGSSDVYYLRLVPSNGTVVWRISGSGGDQIDLPFTLDEYDAASSADPDELVAWSSYTTGRHREIQEDKTLWMTCWPGDLKPSLKLSVIGRQLLANRRQQQAMLDDVAGRIPQRAGLDLAGGKATLLFLDPGRKHRLLIAWNNEAGSELCRLSDMAKQGRAGDAVIGVIATEQPLIDPDAGPGFYLLRLVLRDPSKSPHLEIVTPDMHPVAAWQAPSQALRRPARSGEAISESDWEPESLPGYGTMDFDVIRFGANGKSLSLGFRVTGDPADRSTRKIVHVGPDGSVETKRSAPTKVWAEGVIRLRKPR